MNPAQTQADALPTRQFQSACSACGRPVDAPFAVTLCRECAIEEKFRVCAEMVGNEIKREPSIVVRLLLLKKFFGVAVNEWERQKLFLVPSADKKWPAEFGKPATA